MTVPADGRGWQFDHIDPALPPRMNEVFGAIRERCPIVHSDRHGGFWAVLSHDAVRQAALDTRTYSSVGGVTLPRVIDDRKPPVDFDPPEHTHYRRFIQRNFTRQAVARFEGPLRELVERRITELVGKGHADLATELARHVPPAAIAMILGLPPEDGELFVSFTTRIFVAVAAGDHEAGRSANQEFRSYLAGQVERLRDAGQDCLINEITGGRVDGKPLPLPEQLAMLQMLVMAGHETTVNGIGTMLYRLATVDGLRRRLVEGPGLIPRMIDECLRIDSPVIAIARTVQGEAELAGQDLLDGDRVVFVLSSANRDPAVFDRPDEFVCPRREGPQVAFGLGVHRCLGEHLALLEMRIVAEEILRLAPDYRLADGFAPQWIPGRMMRGLAGLPVNF